MIEYRPNPLDSSRGSSDQSTCRDSTSPPLSILGTTSSLATMLSVDFSTPLAGPARSARIKQMSNNHPAFEKSRMTQEILVKIQHSLRRMPGVSAAESNEIIAQLQEVGQIISQETSQLVDALMNLNLDQEDTDRSIARMAIEANLAKATTEDQLQLIRDLRDQLKAEKTRSEQAEAEMKMMMEDLEDLTADIKKLRSKHDDGDGQGHDAVAKSLDTMVQHLEEQVNKHRTLWVMRRSDPEAVARAVEGASESTQQDKSANGNITAGTSSTGPAASNNSYAKSLMPLKPAEVKQEDDLAASAASSALAAVPPRISGDANPPPPRAPSVFQPVQHRPLTAGPPPPKFGQLQAGPPRPPPTMALERRVSSAGWTAHDRPSHTSRSGSFSGPQPPPYAQSSFRAQPPPRKGFANGGGGSNNSNSRFRNDYQQSSFAMPDNNHHQNQPPHQYQQHSQQHHNHHHQPQQHRPNSAFGYGRGEYLPNTPTAPGRGKYGRYPDANAGPPPPPPPHPHPHPAAAPAAIEYGGSGGGGGGRYSGGTILITERMVTAWHEQIMDFYAVIRTFVERHANQPDDVRNIKTNAPALWPILLATYHPLSEPEATSYLEFHLRNENSKSCLVTRVIIDFIVNRVWVPGAWSGADAESTYALIELEQDFERTQGQPSLLRQPLLDQQAAILDSIMKSPSHPAFLKHKIEETASSLLANIQPLLNGAASASSSSFSASPPYAASLHPEVYRDLEAVVDNAWELSCRILTSRLTFDFRFPEIGSRFSSQSMLPIWPPTDPLELQAKHWRVALVTTPVVTCRNDTGSNISAHSVSLADVFCMQ